jgi:serine/threonine protein kinase
MRAAPPSQVVRFGAFELNLKAGELNKNRRRVHLQEQPLQILKMLVEHPGEVVTMEAIRRKLWPNDTVVEFDNSIHAAIKKLRLALGDSADKPRYVETVARRGYRLRMPVEWVAQQSAGVQTTTAEGGFQSRTSYAANLIGKKVSHYRVLEMLGGGGMGLVYKAEDIKLGRRVALKFLPEELASDPLALERFEREARAASTLDHPNICTIYEVEEYEGRPFIVMQLLEGQTLQEMNQSRTLVKPVQLEKLLDLAIQIVGGLEAAHERGIIHRDIKPANIFITLRGEAKILDFGLAQLNGGEELAVPTGETGQTTDTSLTRTGMAIGTAPYMSPEQVRGERLDARTDLFSFGLVLYEMATGQPAFRGETAATLHEAIAACVPPPARELNSKLPAKLEEIINKALEKDIEKRYRAASEIRADLRSAAEGLSHQNPAAGRRLPFVRLRAPQAMTRQWWLVAAACVFTLIAVASAVFRFTKSQAPSLPGLPEMKQQQLTANSSENPVVSGAVSPDGTYLVYTDLSGIHIKVIETGETQTVPQPDALKENQVDWFIVPWNPNGTGFLANANQAGRRPSIWTVSLTGGAPRKLRDDAYAWSLSPDGSSVAFTTNPGRLASYYPWPNYGFGDREIWLMDANGGRPRELFGLDENGGFANVQWSPDGQRVAYLKFHEGAGRFDVAMESRSLKGGPATTVLSEAKLQGFRWLPDGRLIYSLAESDPNGGSCNFWEMPIEARTGQPGERARRLTNWAGFYLDSMTGTASGKRLAFRRLRAQGGAFVAELAANGTRITTPRHLTVAEEYAFPTAWTADSKAVVFLAYHNGRWGIFKQSLNEDMAVPIAIERENVNAWAPRLSPNGAWILYLRASKDAGPSTPADLIRVPVTGGPPQLVFTGPVHGSHHCARSPSTLCAIARQAADRKQLIFTSFDPVKGRGRELARFDTDPTADYAWDLSPDGTRIAVLKVSEEKVHILSLSGGTPREVTVKGWKHGQYLYWAADGQGFFISGSTQRGVVLLHVDLRGSVHFLWEQRVRSDTSWAVPSPDGRHLAIMASTWNSNMWMLEKF